MSPGGDAAAAPLIGGRYLLEVALGRGGAGEVWRARHVTLESQVAIKFLHGASSNSESMRKRFLTEARVAAQLKTRYAVHVYDFGITEDGRPYLVMELLEGETLGHRLRRQTCLPVTLAARFMAQAARALERAHALGIVHRDLKPENIIVVNDEDGTESIKVLDFGVAKLVRDLASEAPAPPLDLDAVEVTSLTSFTRTGSLLGTPCYMAPEQILNAPTLDLRADIWALGVVAFECLTGTLPFAGDTMVDLFAHIQCGMHRRACALNPALPPAFDAWFDTACAVDPTHRFPNATESANELAKALGESSLSAPPTSAREHPPLASTPSLDTPARMALTVAEAAATPTPSESHPRSASISVPRSALASITPPPSSRGTSFARGPELLTAAAGMSAAGWRHVVISIWRASPTEAALALLSHALGTFAARHPGGIVMLNVLEGEGAIPPDDVRAIIARDMKSGESYTRAIASVYEGEGFVAARARAIIGGIVLASGRKSARTFANTSEAVAWLAQMRVLKGAPPKDLLAVTQKLRDESMPSGRRH